jgi:anhydro-N-acetylmuramic acid kinase
MMSGTSLDGLDLAFCRITYRNKNYDVKLEKSAYYKFSPDLKRRLHKLVSSKEITKSMLKRMDFELADFYAKKVNQFKKSRKIANVDLMGCHGQTIYHLDGRLVKSGNRSSSSWQIGDSSRLAVLTGLPVISDFRSADIAAGGAGAPLTPICHYHLFGRPDKDMAVLNIGGITNLTFIPKRGGRKRIMASDCGPGNLLVDQLSQILIGKKRDDGGKIALSGFVSKKLLAALKRQAWFKRPYPKSLGREQFGKARVENIIELARLYGLSNTDIMTTASELTVISVVDYIENTRVPDKLIVSGGGVHNRYFMARLEDLIPGCEVSSCGREGIHPDYVEAVSFALLAAMWIFREPSNLPNVTGASREIILGKLTLP